MDVHPDAIMPSALRAPAAATRLDGHTPSPEAAAAHLRARLLKMIVENETSRNRPSLEASKPR